MRRWTTPAVAVLAVAAFALVLVGSAQAKRVKEKSKFDASFTLSWEQCPNLPAGTVITGSGKGKSTDTTEDKRDGTTTFSNHTTIRGEATDQSGNKYSFFYENSFKISNTLGDPETFSGKMDDLFSLDPKGHGKDKGPAQLENGFKAIFTVGPAGAHFDEISSFGDPLDFSESNNGAPICDPL
jgi:hypothetical protein